MHLTHSGAEAASAGPVTVLIDSLDTLAADLGSLSSSAHLVQRILSSLHNRPASSRLILPLLGPSAISPYLSTFQPRTELTLHAPQLLRTLARDYSTAPSNPRIWSLLGQLSGRREGERLVDGALNGGDGEVVVEVVKPERRGVTRVLEVWRPNGEVTAIDSLKLGGTGPVRVNIPPPAAANVCIHRVTHQHRRSQRQDSRSTWLSPQTSKRRGPVSHFHTHIQVRTLFLISVG